MAYNFDANLPIYVQISNDVKRKIVKGEYQIGDKVESVRDLALSYGANPNTVQRALSDLEREGFVRSERTTGRFICDDSNLIESCKNELAIDFAKQYLNDIDSIGVSKQKGIELLEKVSIERGTIDGKE